MQTTAAGIIINNSIEFYKYHHAENIEASIMYFL